MLGTADENAIAKSVVIALGMGLLAAILFGVGLIGGLTPSNGQPSLAAWFLYSPEQQRATAH
jgi:hypothetical protein